MAHESIFPVTAFSEGLTPQQLRGLVERHAVTFETGPWQTLAPGGGSVVRGGWTLDLWGQRSAKDATLETPEATHHVHDVLQTIANDVLPRDVPGLVFAVEPYHGELSMDPRRGFAEEVRLSVVIRHDTENRVSRYAEKETSWLDEITDRLSALGVRRR